MKLLLGNLSIPYLLVIFGGALSAILGLLVMIAWYTHNVTLIQISAASVPMQYNSALGFLLSGLGLLVISRGSHRVGMALGIFVMLIGLLTFAEYILGIDFGIDQLLMKHYITVQTTTPGRMAPSAALCFLFTGIILAVLATKANVWKPTMIVGVLGSLILGLGIIALADYALKLETGYGWGKLTRMAVHTAGGFVILGIAVTSLAWCRDVFDTSRLPSWFSVPIGVGISTIVISLWQAIESHEATLLKEHGVSADNPRADEVMLFVGIILAVTLPLTMHLAQAAKSREKEVKAANRKLAAEIDEREMAEEALQENELQLRSITNSAHDAIVMADDNENIVFWNKAAEHIFGFSQAEAIGRSLSELIVPVNLNEAHKNGYAAFSHYGEGAVIGKLVELSAMRKDGSEFPVELSVSALMLKGKWHAVGIIRDITDRKEAEERIAKINRARMAISACNEALVRATDEIQLLQDICQIVIERGGYRMAWVGYAEHDENKTVRPVAWAGHEDGFLDVVKFSWAESDRESSAVGMAICSGETQYLEEIKEFSVGERCRTEDVKRGYASLIALPLLEDGSPFGVLAIYSAERNTFNAEEVRLLQELSSDLAYGVTALRTREKQDKAEKEVAYLAFHDSLTGLPNRAMLMQSLDFVLAQADRENRSIAVLFIDLDQFKLVNDSLGHDAGDELLRQVAERLNKILRKSDIVARQGGDEFIVMLTDSDNRAVNEPHSSAEQAFGMKAGVVAQKIITVLSEPYRVNDNEAYVGASIGISLFPTDARDAHTLLQHADSAMYRTKELGRGEYHFYSHDLSERQQQRLLMETRLHRAIEREEFELWYQPIIDLNSGNIIGSEALIRWQPADGPMLMPDEFIPIAEDSGMIISIGQWVAEEASRQLHDWQNKGLDYYVAINLSVRQLWQRGLVNQIIELSKAAGISTDLLQLEVTESAMVNDPVRMEAILRDFDSRGFKISLDDFGTGYSSLSRLTQLPIHTLKIDKSFVDGIAYSNDARAVVTTIVELSNNLGINCLAEGVETVEQWAYLKNLGCAYAQGYHFSRPIPAADIEKMFEHKQCWKLEEGS